MDDNHFQRHSDAFHPDPKIGRIFLVSLGLHLLVVLIFSGAFSHQSPPPKRPVYYVDLTKLPVANPRAGRPDGGNGAPKTAQKAPQSTPATAKKAETVVKKAAPPPPAKKAVKPSAAPLAKKTAPTSKAIKEQPSPKAAATAQKSTAGSEADYQAAMSAVEKLRRKREMDALKQKLAALAGNDSRAGSDSWAGEAAGGGSSAPLGMPDGTGDQAGVSQELWLQERLTKNWSLSKYQVIRRDIEARVRISYSADGVLTGKQFLKSSGDSTFDDSVTRAILKSRQLEFKPGRNLEVVVIFNLKDLMD